MIDDLTGASTNRYTIEFKLPFEMTGRSAYLLQGLSERAGLALALHQGRAQS